MWRLDSLAEFSIFHKIAAKLMTSILNIIDIFSPVLRKRLQRTIYYLDIV